MRELKVVPSLLGGYDALLRSQPARMSRKFLLGVDSAIALKIVESLQSLILLRGQTARLLAKFKQF